MFSQTLFFPLFSRTKRLFLSVLFFSSAGNQWRRHSGADPQCSGAHDGDPADLPAVEGQSEPLPEAEPPDLLAAVRPAGRIPAEPGGTDACRTLVVRFWCERFSVKMIQVLLLMSFSWYFSCSSQSSAAASAANVQEGVGLVRLKNWFSKTFYYFNFERFWNYKDLSSLKTRTTWLVLFNISFKTPQFTALVCAGCNNTPEKMGVLVPLVIMWLFQNKSPLFSFHLSG